MFIRGAGQGFLAGRSGLVPGGTIAGDLVILGNTSTAGAVTLTGAITIGGSFRVTPESIKTGNYTANSGDAVIIMNGVGLTLTLPASPGTNQRIAVRNQDTGNLTVGRNAQNINGAAADLTVAASTSVVLSHVTGSGWFVVG